MADQFWVAGATPIYVGNYGDSFGDMGLLGYCRNMPEIEEHEFAADIQSDLYGGDLGPPADRQIFGIIAIIRLEMSKFDQTIWNLVKQRLAPGGSPTPPNAGVFPPTFCGSVKFQGGYGYRLLLLAPNLPYNYPLVEFTEPITFNEGTQYQRTLIVATAHADRNTPFDLYNYSIS